MKGRRGGREGRVEEEVWEMFGNFIVFDALIT